MQSQPDSSYGLPLETGGPSRPDLLQLFLFLFLEDENQNEDQTRCLSGVKKKRRSHRPRSGTEEGQMYRGCISVYVHAHSLPALRDSPRHGDSQ